MTEGSRIRGVHIASIAEAFVLTRLITDLEEALSLDGLPSISADGKSYSTHISEWFSGICAEICALKDRAATQSRKREIEENRVKQLEQRDSQVPYLMDRIAELEGVIRDLLAKNYGGNPEIAKDFSFTVDLLASAKDEDEYREAMNKIKETFDGKLPSFWQDAMKEAARKVQNAKT